VLWGELATAFVEVLQRYQRTPGSPVCVELEAEMLSRLGAPGFPALKREGEALPGERRLQLVEPRPDSSALTPGRTMPRRRRSSRKAYKLFTARKTLTA
jgi:hypothetical protein